MDEDLIRQQKINDIMWRRALAERESWGNLQTNLEFLRETNLIKYNDKVLEIGCGTCRLVYELTGRGYDITGIDISKEAIEHGLKKYGDIKLQVQPAEKLQFADETFDIVLSFDLFEHIIQPDRHLSEVRRVLKKEGYYLFQTPNKYTNPIYETLRYKSLGWLKVHVSLHSYGQLKRRLSKHVFQAKFVKMNPVSEYYLNKLRRILEPMSNIFKHIDFCKLPFILQTNLYVAAQKL